MRQSDSGAGARRAPWLLFVLLAIAPLSERLSAQRGSRRASLAIEVGTIHPVSRPAIQNGVILVRGSRIVAVGPADAIEIPEGIERISHPEGHAYPGFVDAMSTAFCDAKIRSDTSTNAGTEIVDGLDSFDENSADLVASGITTAYVANRSDAKWRGLGCVIRLRKDSFLVFPNKRSAAAQLRMTTGPRAMHVLQRTAQLDAYAKVFDGLDAYDKSFAEFDKKKKEYDEAFAKYLEYHRKKSAEKKEKGDDAKEETKPPANAETPPERGAREGGRTRGGQRGGGERGGRTGRGRPPSGGERGAGPRGGRPGGGGTDAAQAPESKAADGDKAPERPKYPKEPKRDTGKEALKKIKSGDLTLRIEAHRPDEVEAALELAREEELKSVVLEHVTMAGAIAQKIADSGVPVIVTDVAPPSNTDYVSEDRPDRPAIAALVEAGVPVAIGSGSLRRARHLPMLAAEACGHGLDADAAVRAITLTPAELLGIHESVGSLEPRKTADIVITSGPLLASDSRILRVIAGGRTQYEVQR